MSAYDTLAKFYDSLTQDYDYGKYYEFVKKHIGKTVVELGAGTGKFTLKYINSVEKVYLVERSESMLSAANTKLLKQRKKCNFIVGDMETFKPIHPVDTVIAVCDGFNYVQDLCTLLKHIDAYVKDGGSLIFDISSEYKLVNVIGNNVFYEDGDDMTYLWTNTLDVNSVEMDVVIFEKMSGGSYVRSDDISRQYIHNSRALIEALQRMNYSVDIYDGDKFTGCADESLRHLFIAVKGGKPR